MIFASSSEIKFFYFKGFSIFSSISFKSYMYAFYVMTHSYILLNRLKEFFVSFFQCLMTLWIFKRTMIRLNRLVAILLSRFIELFLWRNFSSASCLSLSGCIDPAKYLGFIIRLFISEYSVYLIYQFIFILNSYDLIKHITLVLMITHKFKFLF